MSKHNQNHSMAAGETKSISIPCVAESTGVAIDFTAATVAWTVKNRSGTTIISKTLISGISASGGTLTISLATGDTTNSMTGSNPHECWALLASGTNTLLFDGSLTVRATIV